jgi:hypothetical protein
MQQFSFRWYSSSARRQINFFLNWNVCFYAYNGGTKLNSFCDSKTFHNYSLRLKITTAVVPSRGIRRNIIRIIVYMVLLNKFREMIHIVNMTPDIHRNNNVFVVRRFTF